MTGQESLRMSFRFALVLLSVLLAPAARADVITLRADEWCPYNCAENSDRPGYAVEIAREVFGRAGHSVEYRTMAWSRALQECRKGLVTGVVGAAHTEVPDFIFPQEPVAVADITFAVPRDRRTPADLAEIVAHIHREQATLEPSAT